MSITQTSQVQRPSARRAAIALGALTALPIGASIATAPSANASVGDCITVARKTFQVTKGNFGAALAALRATKGCSASWVNLVCSDSNRSGIRGMVARAQVRLMTFGQYDRC